MKGGLGKVHLVLARADISEAGGFGDELNRIIEELNGVLAA